MKSYRLKYKGGIRVLFSQAFTAATFSIMFFITSAQCIAVASELGKNLDSIVVWPIPPSMQSLSFVRFINRSPGRVFLVGHVTGDAGHTVAFDITDLTKIKKEAPDPFYTKRENFVYSDRPPGISGTDSSGEKVELQIDPALYPEAYGRETDCIKIPNIFNIKRKSGDYEFSILVKEKNQFGSMCNNDLASKSDFVNIFPIAHFAIEGKFILYTRGYIITISYDIRDVGKCPIAISQKAYDDIISMALNKKESRAFQTQDEIERQLLKRADSAKEIGGIYLCE